MAVRYSLPSVIINGGAGSIGSHFLRLFVNSYPNYKIVNVDALTYVKDRPEHDRRYAIDATEINKELGWAPSVTFEEGQVITIDCYLSNTKWLKNVTFGTYKEYYDNIYSTNR